jgi:hypothetical protein
VSGNILLIRVKEEDLDKTRLLVQIQWLALRMAAISGAAEVVDDLIPNLRRPRHKSQLPETITTTYGRNPSVAKAEKRQAAISSADVKEDNQE